MGEIQVTHLASLPYELLAKICKSLETSADVFALLSTCSLIRCPLLRDSHLWHHLYLRKWCGFPLPRKLSQEGLSWYDLYRSTKEWNVANITTSKTISSHSRGVTSLCLDGNYLFSGSHDTSIKVYSSDTLDVVKTLEGHKYTIWALASDGFHLYSGSNDHTIMVWDLETFSCVKVLREHESKIFGLEIKDKLLFSSGDKIVKAWNRNTLKPVHTLEGHEGGVNAICISGDHLLSGASDATVRIWDIHTMECLKVMRDTAKILSIAASYNLIFTGLQDCMIKVWDSRSYTCVASLHAHSWEVWQLALAGGYLFSGSFDHKIKVWDIRSPLECVGTLGGHRSFIHALCPDTDRLYSGSADKSIRMWSDRNVESLDGAQTLISPPTNHLYHNHNFTNGTTTPKTELL